MHARKKTRLASLPRREAKFIEPMECLAVSRLPEGPRWVWEIKLDGYRAIAVRAKSKSTLFSRNGKSFNKQYPHIVDALDDLPDGTALDGEVVALDDSGRPNFNLLQNFKSEADRIHYFVFDLLIFKNRDLTSVPLAKRREMMRSALKFGSPRVRISENFDTPARNILHVAREQHLEGVIGKRKDSLYESGKRSGAWVKHRLNRGQEFLVGGYMPGPHGVDSVILRYYEGEDLIYVARTRNGFVPASRHALYERLKPLRTPNCPFVNLPENGRSRWGEPLDAKKMENAVWWSRNIRGRICLP
jgi:ATP-dependent DNA ligase